MVVPMNDFVNEIGVGGESESDNFAESGESADYCDNVEVDKLCPVQYLCYQFYMLFLCHHFFYAWRVCLAIVLYFVEILGANKQ